MTKPRIECAQGGDGGALAAIYREAFEGLPGRRWSVDEFESLLANPAIFTAVIRSSGGSLAGYVVIRAAGGEAEILSIAAAKGIRRQGVARALLAAALTWAGGKGAARIFLEVGESNAAARAFYGADGFLAAGHRPRYYPLEGGGFEDALILARDVTG